MSAAGKRYLGEIAAMRCVICVRFDDTGLPTEVHHVAEGSGVRSDFAAVPLCGSPTDGGHHRGPLGFHGSQRGFLMRYRPPGESEYGLLVWVNEDRARSKK